MGVPSDGILAYGYDLGSAEVDWNVDETGEYGELITSWYDGEADFADAVEEKLLEEAGFTKGDWRADGYFDRRRQALAVFGVEVVVYCSDSCSAYILAAHSMSAARGETVGVDPRMLDMMQPVLNARLSSALSALELTPQQEAPRWLLASYWGQ